MKVRTHSFVHLIKATACHFPCNQRRLRGHARRKRRQSARCRATVNWLWFTRAGDAGSQEGERKREVECASSRQSKRERSSTAVNGFDASRTTSIACRHLAMAAKKTKSTTCIAARCLTAPVAREVLVSFVLPRQAAPFLQPRIA